MPSPPSSPPPRSLRRDPLAWALLGLVLLAGVALLYGRAEVVFQADSPWGRVTVEEGRDGTRALYLEGSRNRQTAMDPDNPLELVLPYTRVALAGLALVPDSARILFVGLGGGAMPTWVREVRPRARVEVVEINPEVAEAAVRWFDFHPGPGSILHLRDGREFMEASPPGRFDLVVLDAFSESSIPRRLATVEFVRAVKRALAPGGVAVSNLHRTLPEYRSMLATWEAVFPQVVLVDVPRRRQSILFATGDPTEGTARRLSPDAFQAAVRRLQAALPGEAAARVDFPGLLATGWSAVDARGASILTDGGPGG